MIIRRKVNHGALRVIEIIVIALLPLCIWPIILSGLCLLPAMQVRCTAYGLAEAPQYFDMTFPSDIGGAPTIPIACTYTTAFAILALSVVYIVYTCVTLVIDKVQGNTFLPKFCEELPLSSSGIPAKPFVLGARRTPAERAAVVDHCSSYIFQHSVFRKHTYVPGATYIFLHY